MMIFIGLVLLTFYIVGLVNGGWFKESIVKLDGFEEYCKTEEFKKMDESEKSEVSLKFFFKVAGIAIFLLVMAISLIVFLIGALSVDILLVPTILIIGWLVIKFILICTSKKIREKNKNKDVTKVSFKNQAVRTVYIIYILYILALIIF